MNKSKPMVTHYLIGALIICIALYNLVLGLFNIGIANYVVGILQLTTFYTIVWLSRGDERLSSLIKKR